MVNFESKTGIIFQNESQMYIDMKQIKKNYSK